MTKKRFPIGTVIMTLISVVYLSPLFIVLINSSSPSPAWSTSCPSSSC